MPIKSLTPGRLEIVARAERPAHLGRRTRGATPPVISKRKGPANEYHCAIERTQNRKFNVRLRAVFSASPKEGDSAPAPRDRGAGWTVSAYFLASSFDVAMKKLAQSLQLLQKNEERLRFWGVERSDDPNVAGDLLQEFGLWLDRRRDFPRKTAEFKVPPERAISPAALAPVRRILADSIAERRPIYRTELAGD